MKKHPVDDLFSRKLRDAEIAPREEVYQKFQERLQTKQRRLGWWQRGPWLAAAGVSLLLVAGWVVWSNYTSEDTLTAQATPKTESVVIENPSRIANPKSVVEKSTHKKDIVNHQIVPEQQQVAIVEGVSAVQKKSKLEQALPTSKTHQQQIAQVTEVLESDKQKTSLIAHEERKNLAEVQVTAPATEAKPTERTVVLQLPELQQTLVTVNEKAVLDRSDESANLKLDDNILNQSRKSSRMVKVWKQLKNAKNGEKVDWNEVGFNPNKLLAKATGKDF